MLLNYYLFFQKIFYQSNFNIKLSISLYISTRLSNYKQGQKNIKINNKKPNMRTIKKHIFIRKIQFIDHLRKICEKY